MTRVCTGLEEKERDDKASHVRNCLVPLGSDQSHSSTAKAANIAGVNYKAIPTRLEDDFAMTGQAFQSILTECKLEGHEPFFITTTPGTRSTAQSTISRRFHPSITPLLSLHPSGFMSMSLTLLRHEYAQMATREFPCIMLFVRDQRDLTDVLTVIPPYLRNEYTDNGLVTDYRDWQIPLGRRFRSLKIWFVLRTYGVKAMQTQPSPKSLKARKRALTIRLPTIPPEGIALDMVKVAGGSFLRYGIGGCHKARGKLALADWSVISHCYSIVITQIGISQSEYHLTFEIQDERQYQRDFCLVPYLNSLSIESHHQGLQNKRMADYDNAEYNNSHRAFLQAFIARSTLTFEEAKPILAAIFGAHGELNSFSGTLDGEIDVEATLDRREYMIEDVTEADFNSYVSAANSAISAYDLEIRSTYHQITRQRIYALVNSTSDPVTQLATIHTADEISYLKRLLDAMFDTYNTPRHEVMAVTSMQAVGLAKLSGDRRATQNDVETQGSAGQSLTLVQAEKMLKTLVEEGWFEKSRKGFYSLTPRALMELRGWLIETYNDDEEEEDEEEERVVKIKLCYACKEIITTGQRCANRDCSCRLHDICTQRFFTTQKSRKCPLCKTDWTGNEFVGERAAARMKEKAKRMSTNNSTTKRQSTFAAEEDIDGEKIQDEDQGILTPRGQVSAPQRH
ncbi:MAG: hypothetical protein Q9217_002952 [Psora testacea]